MLGKFDRCLSCWKREILPRRLEREAKKVEAKAKELGIPECFLS